MIVSPIAGTTRDSIDTPFEKDGEKYMLIDTAGIRRRSKVNENIEKNTAWSEPLQPSKGAMCAC